MNTTPSATTKPITVEIWSDIQCPWCYIGKRRFEEALAEFDGEVEVEFRSFELAPDAPVDVDLDEYMVQEKCVAAGETHPGMQQLIDTARSVGLEFDYRNLKATNSAKAHQLIHFARKTQLDHAAEERLFEAYFINGEHIGHLDVLLDIAVEIGLDRESVEEALRNHEYLDAVRADEAEAVSLGATGVPFFVFDRKYGLSGAQRTDAILAALQKVQQERA